MAQWLQILREFGFPIFVCVWFMWRMERKSEREQADINRLILLNTLILKSLDIEEEEVKK